MYGDREAQDHDPEAKDDDPEAQDHNPEAKDHDPETKDRNPEVKDRNPEAQDHESEAQDDEPEAQDDEPEAQVEVNSSLEESVRRKNARAGKIFLSLFIKFCRYAVIDCCREVNNSSGKMPPGRKHYLIYSIFNP